LKHLKPFNIFNENITEGEVDITIIAQAIGLLKNPPNEAIGAPAEFLTNKILNKETIQILEGMAKGTKPNENDLKKIGPFLEFMDELQDRSEKDSSVQVWLAKYQKDGSKSVNLMDPIKSTLKQNREKNPLFGN
jgi:hypothetical protein